MDIGYFLQLMNDKNASDMFLTTGAPVHIKVEGKLYPLGESPLPTGMVRKIAYSLMDDLTRYKESERRSPEMLKALLSAMSMLLIAALSTAPWKCVSRDTT